MSEYDYKLDEYLVPLIKDFKEPYIVEFGVRKGISTKKFLDICDKQNGHLLSVDTINYENLIQDKRWTFLHTRDDNFDFIKKKIPEKVDVIYLDSVHEATHVKKIIYAYYNLLKVGGYFVIDDISHIPYLKNKERNNFYCEINNMETYNEILYILNSNETLFDLSFTYKSSGLAIIKKIKSEDLKKEKKIHTRKLSLKNLVRLIWRKIKKN